MLNTRSFDPINGFTIRPKGLRRYRSWLWLFFVLSLTPVTMAEARQKSFSFDLQGHRGARGLLPENTLPAFQIALELGVQTLELDVGISADSQVVVSHDPIMSTTICSNPDGTPVDREIRIFDLTFEEIQSYDCGLRGNPNFPDQQRMPASKPLLSDVIAMERQRSAELGRQPAFWNIETKSTLAGDGTHHPDPEVFARLLYEVVQEGGIQKHTVIQSFDPRTLQVLRAMDPSLRLSILVDSRRAADPEGTVADLGFTPEVYSPNHAPLTVELVKRIQAMGMEVVPWTVNDPVRMQELLEMGVDGLITDYPDRALPLRR
ncbi:MAG: glycerophosphoryl diester phosphodiesterase [Rhodothermales bacterium]|jgi:glycerophosphoryl diester phosphodiesterase